MQSERVSLLVYDLFNRARRFTLSIYRSRIVVFFISYFVFYFSWCI